MEDGLEITDVVPRGTREEEFLTIQSRYFSFYNMYAVTQEDFDYTSRQKQLYAFHSAFSAIPEIIREADGSLPTFWLQTFRDWLLGEDWQTFTLQSSFNSHAFTDKTVQAFFMP